MFDVPRNFNKLDLRDFLWHAYGVPALRVRSFLRAEQARFGDRPHHPNQQSWWWPRPSKRMLVEMAPGARGGDFVWPDPPKDLKPYVYPGRSLRQKGAFLCISSFIGAGADIATDCPAPHAFFELDADADTYTEQVGQGDPRRDGARAGPRAARRRDRHSAQR